MIIELTKEECELMTKACEEMADRATKVATTYASSPTIAEPMLHSAQVFNNIKDKLSWEQNFA